MGGAYINFNGTELSLGLETYNFTTFKEQLGSVSDLNIEINDLETQLSTRLDPDQIFGDLTNRRNELAQAIPSLQANIYGIKLKRKWLTYR